MTANTAKDQKDQKDQNDGLFLLEVLIDKVTFEKTPCLTDRDFRTCVTVECLNVAPLEICDDEPGAGATEYKSGGPFVKNFNNGKSCLFSLQSGEISKAMSGFQVKVIVSKSLPCGCLPNKIILGEATIDMTKEFVQTRNDYLKDPNNVSYQALKDSFKIRAPDNTEVGDVIMFLRISCFGKLIITKFQGSGGPPQLSGGSGYVDRSCNPPRESQTRSDPCACGVGRSAAAGSGGGGGGMGPAGSCVRSQGGPCPVGQSYYNSAPCQEPDEPCFCSGARPEKRQQLACRNTDPYCLHLPKGPLLSLPVLQDNLEDSRGEGNTTKQYLKQKFDSQITRNFLNFVPVQYQPFLSNIQINFPIIRKIKPKPIYSSSYIEISKRSSVSFSNIDFYADEMHSDFSPIREDQNQTFQNIFGEKETTVFMTLIVPKNDKCRTSETQATAQINKCLQVSTRSYSSSPDRSSTGRSGGSGYSSSASRASSYNKSYNLYPISSQRFVKPKPRTEPCSHSCSVECRGKKAFSTSPCKALLVVKVKERPVTKQKRIETPEEARMRQRAEKMGTKTDGAESQEVKKVAHLKIGPRGVCPVYQGDPCEGPKCVSASEPEDPSNPNPVQTKDIHNPRRGVFELVVRKPTGVPELLMEWRPPKQLPTPSCCADKCKKLDCLPSSCNPRCLPLPCKAVPKPCSHKPCLPKSCFPRACGQPCLVYRCNIPKPCFSKPCSKRGKPCRTKPLSCKPRSPCPLSRYRIGTPATRPVPLPEYCPAPCLPSPCRPSCLPCPPSPCSPCPPLPCCNTCLSPCGVPPCSNPCKPSPCSVRLCPVGRKLRCGRKHPKPKIRAHRKRISPCYNRYFNCPVVRCRRIPEPFIQCCTPSKSCCAPC